MHYLVTGGAGFVGSHLTETLVRQGHKVTVLDNLNNGSYDNLESVMQDIGKIIAQVEDCDNIKWGVKFDGIFHLATHPRSFSLQAPKTDIETNCKGMIAVLELARKHDCKVVFTSNSGIYGSMAGDQPITEKSGDNPTTPYDANKLVSEHYCKIYHRIHGVRSCIVRFATVYGERQKINPALNWRPLVATMLREVLGKRKAIVGGDGNQTRDLIYVLDAVQGVIKAMDSASDNASVHILSTNIETSVNDVLKAIIDLTGINPDVEHVAPIPAEIRRVRLDYSKAKQALGFEPRYTLRDGLQRMLPYMVKA